MKRIISLFVLSLFLIALFPLNTFAVEEKIVSYFDDGSYIVERIYTASSRASGTKTGLKEHTYYDGNGNADWTATLSGTFTYTGNSSTCTAASCNVTIYDSAWYVVSKSASKSGNTANASVTMGEKLLGVTVTKVPTSLSLKCDANGNLS